jgi:hypothetical protein
MSETYSYQHGPGVPPYHQSSRSTRLRRHSLRVSLLPPESEDISLQSIDEEALPDDQRTFVPSPPPPSPSLPDNTSADESDDAPSDHSTYQEPNRQRRKSATPLGASNNPACPPKSPAKKSRSKRKGRSTKKKSTQPPSEILQGLGPIPTCSTESQSNAAEPRIYASVANNDSHKKSKRGSVLWQYAYGLKSKIQPASYSLDRIPVLEKSPDVKAGFVFVGCRLCNQPPPGQNRSA